MPVHLYQSKKVQRYLGAKVYDDLAPSGADIDPLLIWYADVFFLRRERHLVIANPLTKFTFFVLRHTKKTHSNFLEAFKRALAQGIGACGIDPLPYLGQCDQLLRYTETNRSASGHLCCVKDEYGWMMARGQFDINLEEQQEFMNHHITRYVTSYHKNGYDFPRQRLHHELLLRRWA